MRGDLDAALIRANFHRANPLREDPDGTLIVVKATGAGDFLKREGALALKVEGRQRFFTAVDGARALIASTGEELLFDLGANTWASTGSIWYERTTDIGGLGARGATDVGWETEERDQDTWVGHSVSIAPEQLSILWPGDYLVRFRCDLTHSSGNGVAVEVTPRIKPDGGAFADYVRGISDGGYVDANSFKSTLLAEFEVALVVLDVVKFQLERSTGGATPGDVNVTGCRLEMRPLRRTVT